MGVGSTGVAALELNRRFIGVELDQDYFTAAKKRVENCLAQTNLFPNSYQNALDNFNNKSSDIVREPFYIPTSPQVELNLFFDFQLNKINKKEKKEDSVKTKTNIVSNLSPIIKWPGGKEKELKYIIPNLPSFNRYFEPFVGGGSVFMGISAKKYFINDFSSELIDLYNNINNSDEDFFRYAELIDLSWKNSYTFFESHFELVETYIRYRNRLIGEEELKNSIDSFCKSHEEHIKAIIGAEFSSLPCILIQELKKNLFRKMVRMNKLEIEKHTLPDADLFDNIETAIKSAVYMNYRSLYNTKEIKEKHPKLYCALFFFIRNYAYSGMFRYSSKGEFNVPYGGIAYNKKLLKKKLDYYRSIEVLRHFSKAKFFNLDFEDFLEKTSPKEDDFIFLDPPYDSEFSTYAQNEFTKDDQLRLATYLLTKCKAKWMMIIKNTDFIYNLYDKPGITISTFNKEYVVSFMNRNDKKVTHLLITNY
ncbi:MAG: DNA adenine methylase [Prevotella sp.]|nr:DNA adenine methylase [Prevotella sp.]